MLPTKQARIHFFVDMEDSRDIREVVQYSQGILILRATLAQPKYEHSDL